MTLARPFTWLLLAGFLLSSQKRPEPGASSSIAFENIVVRSGIDFVLDNHQTPNRHQIETMIGGVAVFDYNNDGLSDVYFVNGATIPELDKSHPRFYNRLYRNNGNLTFTDVTERAGVHGQGFGMGVAVGDYDNDGWADLYLPGVNHNQLLRNNGDGSFTDVTARAGVAGRHPKFGKPWAISAGWFDYDNDGRLDLIVIHYVRWSPTDEPVCTVRDIRTYCSPNRYQGLPNMLFHNNGDGTFSDASVSSGIAGHIGKGMGVAFADYDNNGFTDVFVSNDTHRNFLFRNNGDSTFSEVAVLNGVAYNEHGKAVAGMGADFRDVDNDGRPDIWVVAMVGDTFPLFRNRGRDFLDITSSSGIARVTASSTAWGNGIFDLDNDGFKDLFASQAAILDNSEQIDFLPAKLPNAVLRNLGGGRFADGSASAGSGFSVPRLHRGAAFGDLNNDGRIDIVVTNLNSRPEVLVNRSVSSNHWLSIRLRGVRSNRDGLGARMKISLRDGVLQYNHASTSVGYASASDRRVHFGLGSHNMVERIEILWPSGVRQILTEVKADRVLDVREETASIPEPANRLP